MLDFEKDVLPYAENIISYQVHAFRNKFSPAELEEVAQDARVEALLKFDKLSEHSGWKSYLSMRIKGLFLDSLKKGTSFGDSKSRVIDGVTHSVSRARIVDRSEDLKECDELDLILAKNGHYSEIDESDKIDWIKLERLGEMDDRIKFITYFVKGYEVTDIAETLGMSRPYVSTTIHKTLTSFLNPDIHSDLILSQAIDALSLNCSINERKEQTIDYFIERISKKGDDGAPAFQLGLNFLLEKDNQKKQKNEKNDFYDDEDLDLGYEQLEMFA